MERRKCFVLTRSRLVQSDISLFWPSELMVLHVPCLVTGQWMSLEVNSPALQLAEPNTSTFTFPLESSRHGSSRERARFWGNEIAHRVCLLYPASVGRGEAAAAVLHSQAFSTVWKDQEL